MARRYDLRRVKIHRCYTVAEAAKLLGACRLTVSRWIKRGLPLVEQKRPLLIHGSELLAFHKAQRPKPKCGRPGELYCVRCRTHRRPGADMVEYIPKTPTIGLLRGVCPECHALMSRFVSERKLAVFCEGLSLSRAQRHERIDDFSSPNSDDAFKKDET